MTDDPLTAYPDKSGATNARLDAGQVRGHGYRPLQSLRRWTVGAD